MLNILANRTYRHLFGAQIVALSGTGLATVALGLLAYELAGASAGAVLGTALAIKIDCLRWRGADRRRLRRSFASPNLPCCHGHCPGGGSLGVAVRDGSLAGVHPYFCPAIRFGGLHPDLSGNHPRRSSRRGSVHARPFFVAAGLRYGKLAQPDACGRTAYPHLLQLAFSRNCHWVSVLGRVGPVGYHPAARAP